MELDDEPGVKIEGIDEALAMFNVEELIVKSGALAAGLQAACNVIAEEVERVTPVKDENVPTAQYYHRLAGGNSLDKGLLKASVKFDIFIDSQGRGGWAVVSHGQYSYVANFLEYGHRLVSHGEKSIREVIGMVKPFPFLMPAAQAVGDQAVDAFVEGMLAVLKSKDLLFDDNAWIHEAA